MQASKTLEKGQCTHTTRNAKPTRDVLGPAMQVVIWNHTFCGRRWMENYWTQVIYDSSSSELLEMEYSTKQTVAKCLNCQKMNMANAPTQSQKVSQSTDSHNTLSFQRRNKLSTGWIWSCCAGVCRTVHSEELQKYPQVQARRLL